MLIVLALVGLLAGISFPSVSSGVDGLRISGAADGVTSFLSSAASAAERRQQPVELVISTRAGAMRARSIAPGYERRFSLPQGVRIVAVFPEQPYETDEDRRFLLYPGDAPPRIGVELANRRGARRVVRVNPVTGVPEVERSESR